MFIEAYKFTSDPLKIHDANDKHYGKNIFTGKSSNYNDSNMFSLANIQILWNKCVFLANLQIINKQTRFSSKYSNYYGTNVFF